MNASMKGVRKTQVALDWRDLRLPNRPRACERRTPQPLDRTTARPQPLERNLAYRAPATNGTAHVVVNIAGTTPARIRPRASPPRPATSATAAAGSSTTQHQHPAANADPTAAMKPAMNESGPEYDAEPTASAVESQPFVARPGSYDFRRVVVGRSALTEVTLVNTAEANADITAVRSIPPGRTQGAIARARNAAAPAKARAI